MNALLSLFPPPSALAPLSAGIDISGGSVKCVVLKERAGRCELASYGETPLAEGIVVGGDIEARDKLVEILRTVRLRYGIRSAYACLPERKAYLYQVLVPAPSTDLKSGVEFDFESHVPLPPAETIFDFEMVRTVEAGTFVSVTAYARRIINQYVSAFADAGIALRSLEVESQALARAAIDTIDRKETLMMIDFGRKTTRIAIAEYGVVAFTATVDVGGDALTTAVMKHFNVPENEAEQIKNEKGFLMNKENKDLVEALMTTVSVVKDEIAKHLAYWNNASAGDIPHKPVSKVMVCGGNANLRGFPEYLEGSLNLPVSVASVWTNTFSLDEYIPAMPFTESLEYATAIGLAMRGRPSRQW